MIIGISGKIASGKSEVLKIFNYFDFYTIDADEVVRDLYKSGANGYEIIKKNFGQEFIGINGEVDRIKLRKLIFSSHKFLGKLNSLIHPLVYERIYNLVEKYGDKNIVIEASYFDDEYLGSIVDKYLWVERSEELILDVLIKERNFGWSIAKNAIALLSPQRKVNYLIKNDSDLGNLIEQVKKIVDLTKEN